MKLKFHLYSPNANCLHCLHRILKDMDQDPLDIKIAEGYCNIVVSDVEDNYYCDFYITKPLSNSEKEKKKPTTIKL